MLFYFAVLFFKLTLIFCFSAIYKTSPWVSQNDTLNNNKVWYTSRFSELTYKKTLLEVYAICLTWPTLLDSYNELNATVTFNSTILCTSITAVEFIGYDAKLKYKQFSNMEYSQETPLLSQMEFVCSSEDPYNVLVNVKQLNPINSMSKWAWTFKIYLII